MMVALLTLPVPLCPGCPNLDSCTLQLQAPAQERCSGCEVSATQKNAHSPEALRSQQGWVPRQLGLQQEMSE